MPCTVFGENPNNEPYRKDHIMIDNGTKHGARSKELHDFCPDCHQRGNYSSLASAVIAEAIEDYCHPKLKNKSRRPEVMANQASARGFLFSDKLIPWAQMAEVEAEDIRNHVRSIVKEGKYVH